MGGDSDGSLRIFFFLPPAVHVREHGEARFIMGISRRIEKNATTWYGGIVMQTATPCVERR